MEFASQIAAVFGVLGLLVGVLLWARHKGWVSPAALPSARNSSQRQLELLERLTLTPHHSLYLLRVNDHILLLAVSPAGISVLECQQKDDHKTTAA